MPPSLYDDVLDAGDRLVAALTAGDFGGAAQALGERRRLIDALVDAALPPPAPALVMRFRDQDVALQTVLTGQITSLADALAATSRAAVAPARYAAAGAPRASLVDTAPR